MDVRALVLGGAVALAAPGIAWAQDVCGSVARCRVSARHDHRLGEGRAGEYAGSLAGVL